MLSGYETQGFDNDWKLENSDWQEFFAFWRGRNYDEETKKPVLTLAHCAEGVENPGLRLDGIRETNNQFYVRNSYRAIVRRIIEFKEYGKNSLKGLVISGQPGTGLSLSQICQ